MTSVLAAAAATDITQSETTVEFIAFDISAHQQMRFRMVGKKKLENYARLTEVKSRKKRVMVVWRDTKETG